MLRAIVGSKVAPESAPSTASVRSLREKSLDGPDDVEAGLERLRERLGVPEARTEPGVCEEEEDARPGPAPRRRAAVHLSSQGLVTVFRRRTEVDKSLQEDLSRALALEELLQKAVRQADTREQVGAGLPPRAPTDGDTLDSLLGHALQFADPALRAEIERLVSEMSYVRTRSASSRIFAGLARIMGLDAATPQGVQGCRGSRARRLRRAASARARAAPPAEPPTSGEALAKLLDEAARPRPAPGASTAANAAVGRQRRVLSEADAAWEDFDAKARVLAERLRSKKGIDSAV